MFSKFIIQDTSVYKLPFFNYTNLQPEYIQFLFAEVTIGFEQTAMTVKEADTNIKVTVRVIQGTLTDNVTIGLLTIPQSAIG